MILLSNAVESNVASATSTYPALILKVQQGSSTMFKNLQVYCPTTMSGSPTEACFATNNWLEAPVKPHNGADDYDFKPGGIIIISYANGNINSPQFVRWLNISDDIIETNYGYILGNPIVPDAVLSIWDDQITLSDPILQKAVSLLPYVQICATGSKNLTASQYIQTIDIKTSIVLPKHTIYKKCGKYGVELIAQDTTVYDTGRYKSDLDYLYNTKEAPNTNFLNICNYLLNKPSADTYKIVDIFNRAASVVDSSIVNTINKDDTTALYLFQMLAGYGSFEKGGQLLNNSIYQNYDKNSIKQIETGTTGEYIGYSNFYNNSRDTSKSAQREKFCSYFWYAFDEGLDAKATYNKEVDRIYAIITHNNLFRLKQSWFADSVSKILVCCAIIATAYPSLEYYILHPETVTNEMNAQLNIFLSSLKDIKDIATESKGNSGHYGIITTSHIASCFVQLLYYIVLGADQKDIKINETKTYKNILLMLNSVINNWGDIYSKLGETLTTKPGVYVPSQSDITSKSQFLWPVPGHSGISSHFGNRPDVIKDGKVISSGFHNGIDISDAGVNKQPVIASDSGTVLRSEFNNHGYGNYIVVDHGNNYITHYAHLSERYVTKGTKVNKGQQIGLVGTTGNSTGPHLHFGIQYNKNWVNPQNYVKYGN